MSNVIYADQITKLRRAATMSGYAAGLDEAIEYLEQCGLSAICLPLRKRMESFLAYSEKMAEELRKEVS